MLAPRTRCVTWQSGLLHPFHVSRSTIRTHIRAQTVRIPLGPARVRIGNPILDCWVASIDARRSGSEDVLVTLECGKPRILCHVRRTEPSVFDVRVKDRRHITSDRVYVVSPQDRVMDKDLSALGVERRTIRCPIPEQCAVV